MARKTLELLVRVQGRRNFPIDMLRYDGAIPASEIDSNKIASTLSYETGIPEPVTVELRVTKNGAPTSGRWESFGWKVVAVYDGNQWLSLFDGRSPLRVFK